MLTPAASSRIGTAAATNRPMPVTKSAAGPAIPPLVGAMPRWSPQANAMVRTPSTTKDTCWTQPFGPASRALTGSAIGLYSSRRNASWTRNAAVNRTGPTSPAQAAARRRRGFV